MAAWPVLLLKWACFMKTRCRQSFDDDVTTLVENRHKMTNDARYGSSV